jgi:hypothetical protein
MRKTIPVTIMAAVALSLLMGQAPRPAEVELKAAQHRAEVEGDLKGAIQQYGAIVAKYKADRGVAAKALVQMAECYQKMGDAESRKIWEQVVRDYADQKEAVTMARARLSKQSGTGDSRMSFRQVWKLPSDTTLDGPVSRDGRYVAYVDWSQNGNLFLHDFSADTNRPLTNTATDRLPPPKVEQFAEETSFSRDGKQVCYSWFRNNRYELRLVELKGDGIPQSRLLFDNQNVSWIAPLD